MDHSSEIHKKDYEIQALQLIVKGFLLIRFFAGREKHYPFIWEIAESLYQIPNLITQQPNKLPEEIEHIEQVFYSEISLLKQQKGTAHEY